MELGKLLRAPKKWWNVIAIVAGVEAAAAGVHRNRSGRRVGHQSAEQAAER
ncbi:MAG: hypothetical protein ACPGVG_16375 [Mycobacterium sp.]